jgi:NADP-dependent 3-hydroxy acid dehydrogenase YdfG
MLLHEVLEKPKKAINQLEFTLAIQPEHPFANYDLALIYYGMEKREKAAMYYEKAFSINSELRTPDNDIAFWYESYLQAELEETNQAVEQLEEVEEVEQLEELEEVTPEVVTPEEIEDYLDPEEALMNEMKDQNELDLEIAELLLEKDEVEDSLSDREVIIVSPEPKAEEEIEIDSTPLTPPNRQSNNTVKTIMITGATSGIGKATAILFAKAGHRLILTGRREGRLNEFKKELQSKYNNDITVLDFDVRYLSAAKRCYNSMGPEWENIDLLINNAGLAKGFDPIHEGDVKHWEVMLDTNVKGLLYTTRIVSPGMVARGHGQIINICSSAGHEVYPNGAVYCASKHAVDALTKGMRLDLFKHGIRVGQVSPGHVEETEFAVVRFDGDKERAKIYNDFNPLTSSDVADAIFYMANAPAHVTIQDIVIMGTQQASNIFIHRSGRNNS